MLQIIYFMFVIKQLCKTPFLLFWPYSDFSPKKKYILILDPGCGPEPKSKTKINSEFSCLHFGIEINKLLKFLTPKNVWVLKFLNFFKILKKIFLYFSHIF